MPDRRPVQIPRLCHAMGAQPAADQQFKYAVTQMGQPEDGDLPDLLGRHVHLKIVFH